MALRDVLVRLVITAISMCLPAVAGALPAGFVEQEIPGPWSGAAGLAWGPDGLMYVVERGGKVWIVENGVKQPTPFLDISPEVGGWRDFGLLGFALHPNFAETHHVYLLYVVDHYDLRMCNAARSNPECQPPTYNPATDEYFQATIGRITRYTADPATNYRTVLPGSRRVLLGESASTGLPILHQSHGTGQLVFGEDGTLLATMGDGASYNVTDVGSAGDTYFQQGLNEGIIRPEENIGALRSQFLGSHNGKMLRLDPETGDGVPSNPFYDAANPRSAQSRTWALGLRNPYRFTKRPGTGSHDPEDADPGVFYLGDVGWGGAEDLHVIDGPGRNLGWPIFEGLTAHGGYSNANVANRYAPNPLFGVNGCAQQYFYARNLTVQQNQSGVGSWPNPCNAAVQIPDSWTDGNGQTWRYFKFMHTRPPIDWRGQARAASFDANGNATTSLVGAAGSPVAGPQFSGNASTGGVWYTGVDFPAAWRNTYFAADYGGGWIKSFVFDAQNRPSLVQNFVDPGNAVVFVSTHPTQGGIYYVKWGDRVRRVTYSPANRPPVAAATPAVSFGGAPLAIQFGNQSTDPDGQPLTHLWDFGDGATSTDVAPTHVFGGAGPAEYTVRLTVTDSMGASADTTLVVSVNNTPPEGQIVAPREGQEYSMAGQSVVEAVAAVSDAEQAAEQLECTWEVELHHNDHVHSEPPAAGCTTNITISPVGCEDSVFFYRIRLRVSDGAGLTTTDSVDISPDCANDAPRVANDTASVPRGQQVAIDVLANDWDVDGAVDPATVAIVAQPAHGFANVDDVTGLVTYVHDASTEAADSFTYVVSDNLGAVSAEATVLVNASIFPLLAISAPTDGGTVDAQRFTVTWTQDLAGVLPTAEVFIDGLSVHSESAGVGEHTVELDTPEPGAHTLLVTLTNDDHQPDAFSFAAVDFDVVKGPTWDSDRDGVPDVQDEAPEDRFACRDTDADTCDDCAFGSDDPAADGEDADSDGLCDAGDFNGCDEDNGGCSPDATCTPLPGDRRCDCHHGFVGDGETCNEALVTADAGPDQVTCEASATLSGAGSSALGLPLTYTWREGEALVGEGPSLVVSPAAGAHVYELTVCVGPLACATDTVNITVGPQGPWPDATAIHQVAAHNRMWCEGWEATDRCGAGTLATRAGLPYPEKLTAGDVAQVQVLVADGARIPTFGVRVYAANGTTRDFITYNAAAKGATPSRWAPSYGSLLTDLPGLLSRNGYPADASFVLLAGGEALGPGNSTRVRSVEAGESLLWLDDETGASALVVMLQAPLATRMPACPPGSNVIVGNDGNNTLTGTAGPDCIVGLGGNDSIDALEGDDVVFGGRGIDVLRGHQGADTLHGGSCNDKLLGAHTDTAVVDASADMLFGDGGADTLYGGDGPDALDGGDGDDILRGGPGDDTLLGRAGADRLYGEDGADRLEGHAGADLLDAGNGADLLLGGDDADKLYGRAGDDELQGEAGDDLLYGGTENDRLFGGAGNDGLGGGTGNDTLDGGEGTDTLAGDGGTDTCTGWETRTTCEL